MEITKADDFIKNKNITVNDDIFSDVYSFDLAYDEVVYKEYFEALSAVKTPHQLRSTDNDKIVFITDGLCGSTCACFTLRAQADHAGLFVGVAGDPAYNKNIQIASFVGGSVMDTT